MCFRKHFIRKMWPIQLPFLRFIVCTVSLSSLTHFSYRCFFTTSVRNFWYLHSELPVYSPVLLLAACFILYLYPCCMHCSSCLLCMCTYLVLITWRQVGPLPCCTAYKFVPAMLCLRLMLLWDLSVYISLFVTVGSPISVASVPFCVAVLRLLSAAIWIPVSRRGCLCRYYLNEALLDKTINTHTGKHRH
jgi:hypothetical protein